MPALGAVFERARKSRSAPASSPFGWQFLAPLLLAGSLNPVNSSLIATALAPIGLAFGVGAGTTAALVTGLYLASAVAQPTLGRVADRFGPRRVLSFGITMVLVGGLLGGLGRSIDALIVARVLIGVGTSAGYPSAMVLVRRRADKAGLAEPPGSVLGALAVAGQATAAVGLPIGGVLVGALGWRAAFLVNLPLALVALAMTLAWLPPDEERVRGRGGRRLVADLDVVGVMLFAVATTSLIVFAMSAARPDWLALTITVLVAIALVLWERREEAPFLDIRSLVRNRPLSATYLRAAGMSLSVYCLLYGVTQWLQDAKGLSASAAGLTMLPITLVGAVASAVASQRNMIRGPLRLAAGAGAFVAIGLVMLEVTTPTVVIVGLMSVFGLTLGLSLAGNQTALYVQATPSEAGIAAGLLRTSNYIGAISAATVISLVYDAHGVTVAGLHGIAAVVLAVNAVVLVAILADRHLPRTTRRGS